jgi:hypothetical protein
MVGTPPMNDTVDLSTIILNYGPSWQYNPVSENSIEGGSVAYIANWTVPATNFPDYIAMYIRNQWALMMYTNNFLTGFITNTTYTVETSPQLYIQATYIVFLPITALVLGVYCAYISAYAIFAISFEYNRVDVAPWWLMEVTAATLPGLQTRYTTKQEVDIWRIKCMYPFEEDMVAQGHRGQMLELSAMEGETVDSNPA